MSEDCRSSEEIAGWLEGILAEELQISVDEVRRVQRFDELGVDSVLAAYIATELEERLRTPVDINIFYEYPDINSLAAAVSA